MLASAPADVTPVRPATQDELRLELLCYMSAAGASLKVIAGKTGLTIGQVTSLLSGLSAKERIAELREKYWGDNMRVRFGASAPRAMDVIDEVLESTTARTHEKLEAAKWVLEKTTGKAKQELEISGGENVGKFLEILAQMQKTAAAVIGSRGAGSLGGDPSVIDVTPAQPEADHLDSWLDSNLEAPAKPSKST